MAHMIRAPGFNSLLGAILRHGPPALARRLADGPAASCWAECFPGRALRCVLARELTIRVAQPGSEAELGAQRFRGHDIIPQS